MAQPKNIKKVQGNPGAKVKVANVVGNRAVPATAPPSRTSSGGSSR